jgi:hypothetical protein
MKDNNVSGLKDITEWTNILGFMTLQQFLHHSVQTYDFWPLHGYHGANIDTGGHHQ